jgi:hypothetical protein
MFDCAEEKFVAMAKNWWLRKLAVRWADPVRECDAASSSEALSFSTKLAWQAPCLLNATRYYLLFMSPEGTSKEGVKHAKFVTCIKRARTIFHLLVLSWLILHYYTIYSRGIKRLPERRPHISLVAMSDQFFTLPIQVLVPH